MLIDLVIKNGNLVTRSGIHRADIGIQNGRIAEIAPAIKGREELSAEGMQIGRASCRERV
jgi:allantoinase